MCTKLRTLYIQSARRRIEGETGYALRLKRQPTMHVTHRRVPLAVQPLGNFEAAVAAAAHNGNVSLLEVYEDTEHGLTAVLKFGGGCQGCSAVDMTLKQGVETTLKANIPELQRVADSTDHTQRENAYFK